MSYLVLGIVCSYSQPHGIKGKVLAMSIEFALAIDAYMGNLDFKRIKYKKYRFPQVEMKENQSKCAEIKRQKLNT